MTDRCLNALGADFPIAAEGSITANLWFGALLAVLHSQQTVVFSGDVSGTTCSEWLLRYRDGLFARRRQDDLVGGLA